MQSAFGFKLCHYAEHALHAPERIASLFHRVRGDWEATAAGRADDDDVGCWRFVINLDELHGGLSQLHANGGAVQVESIRPVA